MRFHTNLPVVDIERTQRFYRTLFQVEPVKARADYVKFLAADERLNISFHLNPEAVPPLLPIHLGFELPDREALDEAFRRLDAEGLAETRAVGTCCYANQDKFWVTDPSGYRWELYYLMDDVEEKGTASDGCCVSSCAGTGGASKKSACC